uniref:Uncharacterized protein n=1 Tax=Labrus bergylta TaxID=56723 RepID=A0A3Q3EJ70_9LABR
MYEFHVECQLWCCNLRALVSVCKTFNHAKSSHSLTKWTVMLSNASLIKLLNLRVLVPLVSFSYEELDQIQSYSANVKYESYKHQPVGEPSKADSCTPADRRKALYQKFYRQVQEERKPADCVVLSVTNQCL